MVTKDIDKIIELAYNKGCKITKIDISFNILRDVVGNEAAIYLLYGAPMPNMTKYINNKANKTTREVLRELDITVKAVGGTSITKRSQSDLKEITKEDNKTALLHELDEINRLQRCGELDPKDAVLARTKIRVELNKNFDMEKSDDERHIIVVPQKCDIICPHTKRECTYMPTKEVCMKHYNLKENDK